MFNQVCIQAGVWMFFYERGEWSEGKKDRGKADGYPYKEKFPDSSEERNVNQDQGKEKAQRDGRSGSAGFFQTWTEKVNKDEK